ncbi:MAG: hypothetical protein ACTHOG_05540 [Marmoricola sp.]
MKKTLKVLSIACTIWAVTGIGVAAQAAPSASHAQGHTLVRPADTGWGPT